MATGNNVVRKEKLRKIHSWTLKFLRSVVESTFGPENSNSMILHENEFNQYSKDGHSVLKDIKLTDVIESAIKADITSLTLEIANTVGDGTTSAVILSSILFERMKEIEENGDCTPYDLIRRFKAHAERLKEEILTRTEEFTAETAYKIAYVSTNGNTEVAETIKSFYEKYGSDVYIDIITSPNKDTYVREFDGLTLDTGYADTCYQNIKGQAACEITGAYVYAFEDPIDTVSMGELFMGIIEQNILRPLTEQRMDSVIPTVILCPKIGSDYDAYMQMIAQNMLKVKDVTRKPPLLIVTNIFGGGSRLVYEDIVTLCGCTWIRKYIDPKVKEEEAKKGNVATLTNVNKFAGFCGKVRSDIDSTVFVAPKNIYKEGTTEFSETYEMLVTNVKNEIAKAEAESKDLNRIGELKTKLHSLQANMIQYAIGGVNVGERDSLRHLVEDAVKSCRSAAKYGVGQAANVEGLLASAKIADTDDVLGEIVHEAYKELVLTLYKTSLTSEKATEILEETITRGEAFDLRSKEFNGNILGSIMSDIIIFDTLSKILSLIITCNQVILPDPKYNTYEFFGTDFE